MLDSVFENLGSAINDLLCQGFLGIAQSYFNLYSSIMSNLSASSLLSGTFSSLFGGESIWEIVTTVHQSFVVPLAESILALFMLIQLIKISQRIDATATLPAVKEVAFLLVFCIIYHWVINNSLDILNVAYTEINSLMEAYIPDNSADSPFSVDFSTVETANAQWGACLLLAIFGLLSFVVALVTYVIATVMACARALQLYVMATFSAIPLTLLGFDETRQAGIGFIKNFCAIVLAGGIMIFILAAYPSILASLAGGGVDGIVQVAYGNLDSSALDWLYTLRSAFAVSILIIFSITKSGAWAKEILGG